MRAIWILAVLVASLALIEAKPKWKQSLKEKKHHLTEEEHRKYCGGLDCPENSACKVKKGGKRLKAVCVKCKLCTEASEGPVCGTDGNDYQSRCHLHYQACMHNRLGLLKIKCHSTCADCLGNNARDQMVRHNRPVLKEERNPAEAGPDAQSQQEQPKSQKFKKWNQWKKYKHDFHKYKLHIMQQAGMEVIDDSNCTRFENATLGNRLLDWFHVLRAEYIKRESKRKGQPVQLLPQMDLRDAYTPYPCGHDHNECREPINFMFHYLDMDNDHVLGSEELQEIKEIPNEHCITQFFQKCDKTKDGQFSLIEFCECFPIEPPCMAKLKSVPTILQRGRPVAVPGHFFPNCDVDGFFMPMQCHTEVNVQFCWCVDRNGGKVEGTYQRGNTNCPDNTVNDRD